MPCEKLDSAAVPAGVLACLLNSTRIIGKNEPAMARKTGHSQGSTVGFQIRPP